MKRPPAFEEASNLRQKARAAGINPDYWFPVEYDRALKPGKAVEVQFWKRSIALYRGQEGGLAAVENRCAHRQVRLSLGEVHGCNLVCAYHGWTYNPEGRVVEIPHDLFGRSMPSFRIPSYPVKVRYGLIWIFPGDPALAKERSIPEIPELEGPDPWACVPFDFIWHAHHSIIFDNLCDLTHGHLHRKYETFPDPKLIRYEAVGDSVQVTYDVALGKAGLAKLFLDRERVPANSVEICYEYPYQRSNTCGKIKHWALPLPMDERTCRVFFLFYCDLVRVPFTPWHIPQRWMRLFHRFGNAFIMKPLLRQDTEAVEWEQGAYGEHFDAPLAELNPAVKLFQELTVRKWEEHLASQRRPHTIESPARV